jgi:DNA (cytosine-5)-methyltransferase 1
MAATTKTPTKPLKAISLYTGAGGLDLGFEAAGFETRVAVEIEPDAVSTLRKNRPSWEVIDQDVQSEGASSKAILRAGQLKEGEADVLIGGPPCQPFSKSGYWAHGDAKRLADPRSVTLGAYLRVLRDAQPRAFLLENVPGLAFSQKDEGLTFLKRSIEAINRDTGADYSFEVALLRAVEYGVPQDRHRVFVIGSRAGERFRFPVPTHMPPSPDRQADSEQDRGLELFSDEAARRDSRYPHVSAWDAIGDLEDDDDPTLVATGKWADLLPTIPEGNNYLFHTSRGEGVALFGWRRRYWSFLLKLAKPLPSWTIAAQPGPAIGPFHWKNRRLSVKEMLRLQTFPESYEIVGSFRSAQRQLGNAVPSALAEVLALTIRRQLLRQPLGRSSPSLLPKRRSDMPPAEPVAKVPRKYLKLVGDHEAHPGTGLGYGALRRAETAKIASGQ